MNRHAFFWGGILVLAGVLILLSNLNLLPVDAWSLIWPLFLVALGVWTLLRYFIRRQPELQHVVVPLEGASEARLHLRHGAGRLQVGAGAGSGQLIEGDFNGGVEVKTSRQGTQLEVDLRVPSQTFPMFGWEPGSSLDWSMSLSPEVKLDLVIEGGASENRIDLSDLQVTNLRLNGGASSTTLTLPARAGFTRTVCRTGVSSLIIRIPDGVAARIRSEGGLSSIHLDRDRFPRSGSYHQSPDYDTAVNKVDLDIETGLGSIDIR